MNTLFEIITGWSAGYQLALALGALVVGGLVLYSTIESLCYTACVLSRGYDSGQPRLTVGDIHEWQAPPPRFTPRAARSKSSALVRLFHPEKGA